MNEWWFVWSHCHLSIIDPAYCFLVFLALFALVFTLCEFNQPHELKYSRTFVVCFCTFICFTLPVYLPHEFPTIFNQLFFTFIYRPPKTNVDNVAETLVKPIQHLQTICTDAPSFIMGYFNTFIRTKSLNHFFLYITCPTRWGKVLEQCYSTIRGANKSCVMAPLGLWDHSTVRLVPTFELALKTGKI